MPSLELLLSTFATQDLEDIAQYTYANHGAAQQAAYMNALGNAFDLICANPKIGRLRLDCGDAHRMYPVDKHRVFYVAERQHIFVLRVLHHKMDAFAGF